MIKKILNAPFDVKLSIVFLTVIFGLACIAEPIIFGGLAVTLMTAFAVVRVAIFFTEGK